MTSPVQPPTTYMNINCSLKSHGSFFVMWRNGGICCMTQSSHASFVNAFFCRLLWVVLCCTTVSIVGIGSVTRSINCVFMHDKALATELFTLEIGHRPLFQMCPALSLPYTHTAYCPSTSTESDSVLYWYVHFHIPVGYQSWLLSYGQSEPAATNAPVGRSVHWMGCVFSFGARWGSS
jgi:hypothetical protein